VLELRVINHRHPITSQNCDVVNRMLQRRL